MGQFLPRPAGRRFGAHPAYIRWGAATKRVPAALHVRGTHQPRVRTKIFRQILPMVQAAVRICLARFAHALARPATHESLAAIQTQTCLALLNAFEFRPGNSHDATPDKTIHQVTFGRGLISIINRVAVLSMGSRDAAEIFSENFC